MSASQQSAPPEQATPTLKTFGFLNAVMFQGALSDNLFKYVVSFLGISLALAKFGEGTPEYKAASGTYTAIAAACMVLPFMLVATFAGSIADKYSKARVTLWTKLLEVAIMGFAVFALAMNSFWFAMAVLFFMGMQSALFSPAKYGILPEIVPHDRVGWANGVLQGATFVAIIVGTLAGPTLYSIFKGSLWIVGLILVGLALAGTWAARQMETTPSSRPDLRIEWNPVPEVRRNLREIRDHDGLAMAVAGMTIWWLCASMLQATAILMGKITLGLSDMETGYALLPISIGIGAGCFLAGRMSKGRIELGLVPIGAMGMFVTCIWTWFAATGGRAEPGHRAARDGRRRVLRGILLRAASGIHRRHTSPRGSWRCVGRTKLRHGIWHDRGCRIARVDDGETGTRSGRCFSHRGHHHAHGGNLHVRKNP
jgi:acyl-[acyl-carrier-protein]-phospholipid O-acyltransferase/long-chain-fatty-acid--[acyl-carrier-protein] ligase